MSKKMYFVAVFVFLFLLSNTGVLAQTATKSSTATNSGTATRSATATGSAVTTLPKTGAHDVLILFSAGLIFLAAGITAFSGTKQVFADIDE